MNSLVHTLLNGLDDYTIDERGDVGSWVRLVSIQGLTTVCQLLFANCQAVSNFDEYMSPELYLSVASGILKQGVERLDNVRHEAGRCFMEFMGMKIPSVPNNQLWELPARALLAELFERYSVHFESIV
jgi:hypothetical protein